MVFLYFYQRNLLYLPNENNYSEDKISVDIENVRIKTSDNIELLGWYHEKNLKDLNEFLQGEFFEKMESIDWKL